MTGKPFNTCVRILIFFVVLTSLFNAFSATTHAANYSSKNQKSASSSPLLPDVYCLNVKGSNITNVRTVGLQNPSGGAVRYTATLYLINGCSSVLDAGAIVANSIVTCPNGARSQPASFGLDIPYSIGPGAGLGESFEVTDYCEQWIPGERIYIAVLPISILLNVSAAGTLSTGQSAFSPEYPPVLLPVW